MYKKHVYSSLHFLFSMSPLVVRHQCDIFLCCKSRVVARDRIEVYPPSSKNRSDLYFPLHVLLSRLPEVPVHGIPTIQRCVINRQKNGCFQLFAEGVNLRVCALGPKTHAIGCILHDWSVFPPQSQERCPAKQSTYCLIFRESRHAVEWRLVRKAKVIHVPGL